MANRATSRIITKAPTRGFSTGSSPAPKKPNDQQARRLLLEGFALIYANIVSVFLTVVAFLSNQGFDVQALPEQAWLWSVLAQGFRLLGPLFILAFTAGTLVTIKKYYTYRDATAIKLRR